MTTCLKLTDHVMKLLERVLESYIREMVSIDEMQFGFVPGKGTTDAIIIVRQLQEKYRAANKPLFFTFVNLEKAFDRVPRRVLLWALRRSVLRSGPSVLFKRCIPMPEVGCELMVSTVKSLTYKLTCIRALFLACCSLSWYWKLSLRSIVLVFRESCCMLTTWLSLLTLWKNTSISSRHGNLPCSPRVFV